MKKYGLNILIISLFLGCSTRKESSAPAKNRHSTCASNSQAASHAAIATRAKSQNFAGCFVNHLKLNHISETRANVCARLTVRANGSVANASVQGDGDSLPNDLRWCLEQELWKMDYSKLQFSVSQKITFPLRFEVRK